MIRPFRKFRRQIDWCNKRESSETILRLASCRHDVCGARRVDAGKSLFAVSLGRITPPKSTGSLNLSPAISAVALASTGCTDGRAHLSFVVTEFAPMIATMLSILQARKFSGIEICLLHAVPPDRSTRAKIGNSSRFGLRDGTYDRLQGDPFIQLFLFQRAM